MGVRRLFRGTVEWARLETVVRALARRYGQQQVRVEFLEADNWLSTPMVVDGEWFVKVITRQNALVHALFTGARNLGAFSSGTEGFFESLDTPLDMANHELEATRRMRAIGVNAPEPVEALEVEGLGVLIMEYLPDFRPLDSLDASSVRTLAPDLFGALSAMHRHDLVHGDLRAENVLERGGALYFIDATSVRDDGVGPGQAYDVACALAVLAPVVGARVTVDIALTCYTPEELLAAREFLDFVNIRPDHDFDATVVKGEVEKRASS